MPPTFASAVAVTSAISTTIATFGGNSRPNIEAADFQCWGGKVQSDRGNQGERETVGVDSDAEVHASLIDPTFRRYREKFKNKGPEDEAEKREMVDYVPELRLIYASVLQDREDEFFAAENDALFEQYYPEYRYRKDMTRRFLLDTNNLLIDILPGSGSALESFKFNHRIIDVYKAAEELKKIELENVRRAERIEEGQLADPDIERVTIVATDESLKDTGLLPTGTTPDTDDDDG